MVVQYSGCDHWDYTCEAAKHQSRSCPTNADGISCSDGSYRMCTDHTHDYSATTLACGHLPSDSGWHKLSYYRGCGHTDWHCLGAARHNPAKCPPGTDGELCTVWSAYPGWHYVCNTAHDHKYPSDSTTDPSDPKEGDSKPAMDGTTDQTEGTTNKKSGETDSTEGNSKQMVLAACGVHQIEKGSSSAHSHREVSCPLDGYGNACDPGSYYACQALEHRHQYPNTPKGFRKVVVCPVASWTGCGGKTVDVHKRTCAAGHSYYTCNETASERHAKH